ncbi:hypothetical protein BAE44_0011658 [Dichanthelium oligosanthes]|uniref:RING-type domain-containing protein n=1 Tax=Dichanthelium oligosanthes TaxID=888268 RepID=A0A1E5VQC3_9POAL|nr:hypothetical protein BAE44_0011658 [Dichanthelium oligosanthes]
MQAMNSRRQGQGQGQDQAYGHMFIIGGPRAGTVWRVPSSSFRGSYLPGTNVPLFDYDLAAAAHLFDDDLPAAAHLTTKRARVAATSEAILGLQEVSGRSREGQECAICLQDFYADETLRAMPCSHAFHHHCISKWLCRNAVCPLCRHQLLMPTDPLTTSTPEEEEEEEDRRRRRRI